MHINIGQLLIMTLTLIALDVTFLLVMQNYLSNQIKLVQGVPSTFKFSGAVGCYVCLIFILYYFIIKTHASILEAFLLGASVYGVYEFTNYASLNAWKITTVITDTLWGGVLFAMTTYITRVFVRRFL